MHEKEGMGMDVLLRNIGLVTLLSTLLVLIKKCYDRMYLQQDCCYEDSTVYAAADKFAGGASVEEVREMLATGFVFDSKGTEEILVRALPHRMEPDGGYRAFIHAVNQVLGEELYRS